MSKRPTINKLDSRMVAVPVTMKSLTARNTSLKASTLEIQKSLFPFASRGKRRPGRQLRATKQEFFR